VDREAAQMTHNNGDLSLNNIIAFSFNIGLLTPGNGKTVLKLKISQALYRLDNYTVPNGWGWHP